MSNNLIPQLRNGLVLWYPWNVSGTTVYDVSWNAYNGTTVNSPTLQRTGQTTGINFVAASSQKVTFPAMTAMTDFSVSFFLYVGSISAGNEPFYIWTTSNNREFYAEHNGSGVLQFAYWNGSSWYTINTSTLSTSTIYHIVHTRSWSTWSTYVNGSLINSGTVHTFNVWDWTVNQLWWKYGGWAANYLTWRLHNFMVYNRAITSTEINMIRNWLYIK